MAAQQASLYMHMRVWLTGREQLTVDLTDISAIGVLKQK